MSMKDVDSGQNHNEAVCLLLCQSVIENNMYFISGVARFFWCLRWVIVMAHSKRNYQLKKMYNYVLYFLVFGSVIWNSLSAENVVFFSPHFATPCTLLCPFPPAMNMCILTLSCFEIRWVSVILQSVGQFLPDNKKACCFLLKCAEVYVCAEEGA